MLLLIEFSSPASCVITPISRFIDPYYSARLRWSPLIVEYSNLFWTLFGSQLVMVASLQLMLNLRGHQLNMLKQLVLNKLPIIKSTLFTGWASQPRRWLRLRHLPRAEAEARQRVLRVSHLRQQERHLHQVRQLQAGHHHGEASRSSGNQSLEF